MSKPNHMIRTLSIDEIELVAGGELTPQQKADAALAAVADFVKKETASNTANVAKIKEALR